MRVLIITAAGTASRFNRDLSEPAVKCIFYRENMRHTILYRMFEKARAYDRVIVVGGWGYDRLEKYIKTCLSCFAGKTELVFNPRFDDRGTGYSLYLGIQAAQKYNPREIAFAEGDLYFCENSFNKITKSENNVITVNNVPIEADSAVAVYEDVSGYMKYIYDSGHKALRVNEPFRAIYNSAQIWKFTDPPRLYELNEKITAEDPGATNLKLIEHYFSGIKRDNISIIVMNRWINCNTVADYDLMVKYIQEEEERK